MKTKLQQTGWMGGLYVDSHSEKIRFEGGFVDVQGEDITYVYLGGESSRWWVWQSWRHNHLSQWSEESGLGCRDGGVWRGTEGQGHGGNCKFCKVEKSGGEWGWRQCAVFNICLRTFWHILASYHAILIKTNSHSHTSLLSLSLLVLLSLSFSSPVPSLALLFF